MFSVNIDKLVKMTPLESECYSSSADAIIDENGDNKIIQVIGNGVSAFKLAYTFVKKGNKILFIDGDFSTEEFLGKYKLGKALRGLRELMAEESVDNIADSDLICYTNEENMEIIFAGECSDEKQQELSKDKMTAILNELSREYDAVVIKSDNAGKMASTCGKTVVIIDKEEYSVSTAQKIAYKLTDMGCEVMGVIIEE